MKMDDDYTYNDYYYDNYGGSDSGQGRTSTVEDGLYSFQCYLTVGLVGTNCTDIVKVN